MNNRKWGESFLKSGIPLEYQAFLIFKSNNCTCSFHSEYQRFNEDHKLTWFENDIFANYGKFNKDTDLNFIIECKYHDLSRFWMFIPYLDGGFQHDGGVLTCGPYRMLENPDKKGAIQLAKQAQYGLVISEDGIKQENSVYSAVQQLSYSYVPVSVSVMYGFDFQGDEPWASIILPVIVTNAKLFLLKNDLQSLDQIRDASKPIDIADEVEWLWLKKEYSFEMCDQNFEIIKNHKKTDPDFKKFPYDNDLLIDLASRPHWLAVANIIYLDKFIKEIIKYFLSIDTLEINHFKINNLK